MHDTDAGRRQGRGTPHPETEDFWPGRAPGEGVPPPLPRAETDRPSGYGRDPSYPSPSARRTGLTAGGGGGTAFFGRHQSEARTSSVVYSCAAKAVRCGE